MKKLILIAVLFSFSLISFGQTIVSKHGFQVLPEEGDIALGVNAVPVLNFFGNMFNGDVNNTSIGSNKFLNYFGNNVIFGKYFLSESTAVRANLRIGVNNFKNTNDVFDDAANTPEAMVTDVVYISNQNYNLGLGYEMRRGNTRLQGYFGGELLLGYSVGNKRTYQYGNGLSAGNLSPTSTTWSNAGNVNSETAEGERMTSQNAAKSVFAGVRPFVGVEYFIIPKISVGLEFGWALGYGSTSGTTATFESYSPTTNAVSTRVESIGGNSRFSADNDNFSGAIFFMFHF